MAVNSAKSESVLSDSSFLPEDSGIEPPRQCGNEQMRPSFFGLFGLLAYRSGLLLGCLRSCGQVPGPQSAEFTIWRQGVLLCLVLGLVILAQGLAYYGMQTVNLLFVNLFTAAAAISLFKMTVRLSVSFPVLLFAVSIPCMASLLMKKSISSPKALQQMEELYEQQSISKKRSSSRYRRISVKISGTVLGPLRRRGPGALQLIVSGQIGSRCRGKVLVRVPDVPWMEISAVRPGDYLSAKVRLTLLTPAREKTPRLFSYHGYLYRQGLVAYGRLIAVDSVEKRAKSYDLREKWIKQLRHKYQHSDVLAMILAVTLGARDLPGQHIWDLFRQTGTSHLLVVSGFHVGLVFSVLFALCCRVFSRFVLIVLYLPVRIPAVLLASVGAAAYTMLSGAGLPAVRALFFIAVYAGGQILGRRPFSCRTLLLALFLTLTVWPGSCFDAGCQLTFLALLGLLTARQFLSAVRRGDDLEETIGKFQRRRTNMITSYLVNTLVYSFFAWFFTLPAQLLWFKSVTWAAPLVNLFVIAPFSCCIICLGGVSVAAFLLAIPFADHLLEMNLLIGQGLLDAIWCLRDVLSRTCFAQQEFPEKSALLLASGILVLQALLVTLSHLPGRFLSPTEESLMSSRRAI